MDSQKFQVLNQHRLSVADLAGICAETVTIASGQDDALGTLGAASLKTLTEVCNKFTAPLSRNIKSPLTEEISAVDNKRDSLTDEAKRTIKTAAKSSTEATATAGKQLMHLFEPFWKSTTLPLMSQSAQINLLKERYSADSSLAEAAAKIGITQVLDQLFAANENLSTLYAQRLTAEAENRQPSASSLKSSAVSAYGDFCSIVEQTVNTLPTPEIQKIFNQMNDVRRKYVPRERKGKTVEEKDSAK